MKKRVYIFLLGILYWYLLFVLSRVMFLLVYSQKAAGAGFSEILKTFVYGFQLDVGISAYIVFLPSFVLAITSFSKKSFVIKFYNIYFALALFVSTFIIAGDLFMYQYWGFRIDATPLFYMTNLKAMTASVSIITVITSLIVSLSIAAALYFIYWRIFNSKLKELDKSSGTFLILFPATLVLIIVMRGGIGLASLTTSTAYFSKNQFLNHAAINPVWNAGFSLTEKQDLTRKYEFYTKAEMLSILEPLKINGNSTVKLLNTNRPNIILIITESFTAKALEATGGHIGIMPNMNQLVKEGVLFDQIYAASDRTDKGISAVIAGYPSLPGTSVLKFQKLTEKLAFIPSRLNANGYISEFFYGGTLDFANYRSFLVQAGFDKIISDKDFPASEMQTKWGAYDHVLLKKVLEESADSDSGFFKTILTLTSHEPFKIPIAPLLKGDDDDTKFLNSLHYTDQALGDFIREAKKKKWWDNTLVIIIADHSDRKPDNSSSWERKKYHIPMIWLGGALAVQDTVISKIASQTDLAATLMAQLDIKHDDFDYSRNILSDKYLPYAFFTFNDGFGFLKPDKLLIFNTVTGKYDESSVVETKDEKEGKAYLQSLSLDSFNKNK